MAILRGLSTSARFGTSSSCVGVFSRVMDIFPEDIQMAFAYGSGVFQQSGSNMSRNMLDFIFVVDDPHSWHSQNLEKNPKHYSTFFRYFPGKIAQFQESFGAGVYFNTLVPFEERLIKYGVVSTKCLISDLKHWDTLYISGRLHKPVNIVVTPTNNDLKRALKTNLKSALHTSLLLLPEKFSDEQLFVKIASLSYSGDFRMVVGEDKGKVKKIVELNLDHFRDLYKNVILNEQNICRIGDKYEQCKSHSACLLHLSSLPSGVLTNLSYFYKDDSKEKDVMLKGLSRDKEVQNYVAKSVAQIVKGSSIWQSLKGIPTAGFKKTVIYSGNKLKKMFKGMLPKTT